MPDGIVNFIITVLLLYSRKNCGTITNYQQARVFFSYNISLITECKISFLLIICSSSDRAMHCTSLVFLFKVSVHFTKDDFTKTETLARTLHEQALNTAHHLRNSGSSDGTLDFKIYYSGCIVQKILNFDP